jgi:hypothetical protein
MCDLRVHEDEVAGRGTRRVAPSSSVEDGIRGGGETAGISFVVVVFVVTTARHVGFISKQIYGSVRYDK